MLTFVGALVLGSVGVPARDVDLVYDARYYFQGHRKSHHQIYLIRHDGKHKFQVTRGPRDCLAPVWLDKDRFAYLELSGAGTQQGRVVVFNVKTGHSKGQSSRKIDPSPDYVGHADGVITTADYDGSKVVYDGRSPRPTGSYQPKERYTFQTTDENGLNGKIVLSTQKGSTTLEWKNREPLVWEQAETIAIHRTSDGSKQTYTLKGDIVETGFQDTDSTLVLLTGTAWTKFTWSTYLYRLDLFSHNARLLVEGVGAATIFPGQSLWVGHQETAPRAFLKELADGRRVYCNWLYSGDWQTGKRWTIAEGLVEVGSANIRPGK